ncbi:MAG: redox-sensitive transcriptional activator SoxR [Actinomycetota bacterium]
MLRSRPDPVGARARELLTIGAVAERTGLAVSAIRFYEQRGLIEAERAPSGHRRFTRATIRRVSFILACQRLGYSLGEIGERLAALPDGRTPTDADWERLAAGFRADLDARIRGLLDLRDRLDGCIGCGCLSLENCAIYNPDDAAAGLGTGPRYLLGNSADDLGR